LLPTFRQWGSRLTWFELSCFVFVHFSPYNWLKKLIRFVPDLAQITINTWGFGSVSLAISPIKSPALLRPMSDV
jgi:hypothetical protein